MGISQQQALDCFASDDLIGIGMEADSVRRSMHPDGVVTYTVDRSVRLEGGTDALFAAIEPAISEGVMTIRVIAPVPGSLTLTELETHLAAIRDRFPALQLQGFTASEVMALAATSSLHVHEVVQRLRAAGLGAIEGDSNGIATKDWLAVHAAAHCAGLRSRASLTFGGPIGTEEFVETLMSLRTLQQEYGGFTSLALRGFQPEGGRAEFEQPTAVEYLRTLAIARMLLDNVEHIEASGVHEGLKVMQMALRFGANDGGAIAGPESASAASFTESDLRRVIRDAGFTPVERDPLYRALFLNN